MEDLRNRITPLMTNVKDILIDFHVLEWNNRVEYLEDIIAGVQEEFDEDYETMREEVMSLMTHVSDVYDVIDNVVVPLLWIMIDAIDFTIGLFPANEEESEDEGYHTEEPDDIPDDH